MSGLQEVSNYRIDSKTIKNFPQKKNRCVYNSRHNLISSVKSSPYELESLKPIVSLGRTELN